MEEMIVEITGDTLHTITIDPGVWIFDERKINLETFFQEGHIQTNVDEAQKMAQAWSAGRIEGAYSPSNDNKLYGDKKEMENKSYGMALDVYFDRATPHPDAKNVQIEKKDGTLIDVSIEVARNMIAGFSKNGQALREDGPIHLYYGDGSNINEPITDVKRLIVKHENQ
ncbi:peptidyl-prolyl cis-trans isomerase [Texcoconibacillus texcoconensis]|uniref:Peptidyl-prolyl cis-trans isomerase n=1 Tax=Texcoconibacillus texcoconensis TaxID=1095777 RepID=A0A840QLJ8_9BACI|nr:peptidyl-prolyl cis-trans isomerase [Texcoconibacillus texcoconensis]MBB5172220.1 hypothetical protein [Texcoconibacillus texcoconensis]